GEVHRGALLAARVEYVQLRADPTRIAVVAGERHGDARVLDQEDELAMDRIAGLVLHQQLLAGHRLHVADVADTVMVAVFLTRVGHGWAVVLIVRHPVVVGVGGRGDGHDHLRFARRPGRTIGWIVLDQTGRRLAQDATLAVGVHRAGDARVQTAPADGAVAGIVLAEGAGRAGVHGRVAGDAHIAAAAGAQDDLVGWGLRNVVADAADGGHTAGAEVEDLLHQVRHATIAGQILVHALVGLVGQERDRAADDLVRLARVTGVALARPHRLARVHELVRHDVVDLQHAVAVRRVVVGVRVGGLLAVADGVEVRVALCGLRGAEGDELHVAARRGGAV